MKIAFLCSSLEPGRDGVGDYARRLSEELRREGHQLLIISLHDRHILRVSESNDRSSKDQIPSVRYPAKASWRSRVDEVRNCLDHFDPDWISLQFVPYGFDDRGLVWSLGEKVRRMADNRRVHLMCHELWIGAARGAPLKDRLIGKAQQMGIRGMVQRIAPAVVSTTNESYAGMLRRIGVSCTVLPLFGNISVLEGTTSGWLERELRGIGIPEGNEDRDTYWTFVFFGTLHPNWPPDPLFSYLLIAAKEARRKIVIAGIGRLGTGERLWAELSNKYRKAFQFIHFGEQTPARISELLKAADFGIATSPWSLIGKSGTVASMLEHGLPVIVNRDDVQFPGARPRETEHPLLIKMDAGLPSRLPVLQRKRPNSMLPDVARMFLQHLDAGLHLRLTDVSGEVIKELLA